MILDRLARLRDWFLNRKIDIRDKEFGEAKYNGISRRAVINALLDGRQKGGGK